MGRSPVAWSPVDSGGGGGDRRQPSGGGAEGLGPSRLCDGTEVSVINVSSSSSIRTVCGGHVTGIQVLTPPPLGCEPDLDCVSKYNHTNI